MFDLMKKTMLAGVGLAAMTKDKVEELARELAKSAQLSSEKGQEFVNEVMHRAERAREDLDATVRRVVDESLARTQLATRADIARLMERIDALESKIASRS